MLVPIPSSTSVVARAAGTLAAAVLWSAPAATQDDDGDVGGSVSFEDDRLTQPEFAYSDALALRAWVTKEALHFEVDMAEPIADGMFTCVSVYIDCDDKESTGIDGAELWVRSAVGSRFHPNSFRDEEGPLVAMQIRNTTISEVQSVGTARGTVERFSHRYDKLAPPEVDGATISFWVPLKSIRQFGGRYKSIIGLRPVVETSCSEQPLLMRITCNDDGLPIEVDGDAAEWSTARITHDPGDELHEIGRFLDITSLRVDHGEGKVFACLKMAAPGFDEVVQDIGMDRRDRVTIYVQPLFPRYQSPVEVVLSWGEPSQSGEVGPEDLQWNAAVVDDTVEFAIERRSGQTQFRIFAWSDVQRVDTIGVGQFLKIDWGKPQ